MPRFWRGKRTIPERGNHRATDNLNAYDDRAVMGSTDHPTPIYRACQPACREEPRMPPERTHHVMGRASMPARLGHPAQVDDTALGDRDVEQSRPTGIVSIVAETIGTCPFANASDRIVDTRQQRQSVNLHHTVALTATTTGVPPRQPPSARGRCRRARRRDVSRPESSSARRR